MRVTVMGVTVMGVTRTSRTDPLTLSTQTLWASPTPFAILPGQAPVAQQDRALVS